MTRLLAFCFSGNILDVLTTLHYIVLLFRLLIKNHLADVDASNETANATLRHRAGGKLPERIDYIERNICISWLFGVYA
jgi:hypothetical protein